MTYPLIIAWLLKNKFWYSQNQMPNVYEHKQLKKIYGVNIRVVLNAPWYISEKDLFMKINGCEFLKGGTLT